MNEKGQSVFEHFLTYCWALVVIILVVAALFYIIEIPKPTPEPLDEEHSDDYSLCIDCGEEGNEGIITWDEEGFGFVDCEEEPERCPKPMVVMTPEGHTEIYNEEGTLLWKGNCEGELWGIDGDFK